MLEAADAPTVDVSNTQARRKDKWFVAISLLAYVLLISFVIDHHEPWGDEGDAWLAARDMTVTQLFHWSHYSGTPLLWYLLLMPLTRAGLPYFSMQVMHGVLAAASVALVLARAPFARLTRLAISFSYLMSYEYAVVARNYAPLVLLTILAAIGYRQRVRRAIWLGTLLALMCSASLHGLCIAGGLGVAWGIDALLKRQITPRVVIGGLIAVGGAIVSLAQVLPVPPDRQVILRVIPPFYQAGMAVQRAVFPLLPSDLTRSRPGMVGHAVVTSIVLLLGIAVSLLGMFLYSLRRNGPLLIGACTALLGLEVIFIYAWYGGDRHAGLIWLLFFAIAWIARRESPSWNLPIAGRWILTGSLWFHLMIGAWFDYSDWRYAYSGSTEAAQFLASYLRPDDVVAATSERVNDEVLPYLPGRQFWNPTRNGFATYCIYDLKGLGSATMQPETAVAAARTAFQIDPHFVFISQLPLTRPELEGLTLVFHNTRRQFFNATATFYVYRGSRG